MKPFWTPNLIPRASTMDWELRCLCCAKSYCMFGVVHHVLQARGMTHFEDRGRERREHRQPVWRRLLHLLRLLYR